MELSCFKVKEAMVFLNKNVHFSKNEMEFKMENPLHSRNTNIVLQLLQELQIKNETVLSWSSQKKRTFLQHAFYPLGIFWVMLYFVTFNR